MTGKPLKGKGCSCCTTTFRGRLRNAFICFNRRVVSRMCRRIFRGYNISSRLLIDNKSSFSESSIIINPLFFSRG